MYVRVNGVGCHWSYPTSAVDEAWNALVGYDQWHPNSFAPSTPCKNRKVISDYSSGYDHG